MSIYEKKGSWYFKIMVKSKMHRGTCDNCNSKKQAEDFEKDFKKSLAGLKEHTSFESVVADYAKELKREVDLPLADVWTEYTKIPRKKGRIITEKELDSEKNRWLDFVAFAESHGIKKITEVTDGLCGEYMTLLATNGRFIREKPNSHKYAKTYKVTSEKLSPRTRTVFLQTLTRIFDKMAKPCGLKGNPFSAVETPEGDTVERETFSEKQLKAMLDCDDVFCQSLFVVASFTALRLGDACTLLKRDIDIEGRKITRLQNKTGDTVRIFIETPFFLSWLKSKMAENPDSRYLLPYHAELYQRNPTGVSLRIGKCLESIGIETSRRIKGRTRAASVLDFHSIRHSVLARLANNGVPMASLQAMAGHADPSTTMIYLKHENEATTRNHMKALSYHDEDKPLTSMREKAKAMIDLMDMPTIEALFEAMKQNNGKNV